VAAGRQGASVELRSSFPLVLPGFPRRRHRLRLRHDRG
jgi:hypothetical protein